MALARSFRCLAPKVGEAVPQVFVTFGIEQQFRFSSHPGVMAITKLLEMSMITRMRANFTEENIEQIKKFDPELSRKATIV